MGCITSTFRIKDTLSASASCKVGIGVTIDALPVSAVDVSVVPMLDMCMRVIPPVAVDMVCTPIDEPEERKPLTASITTKPPLRATFSVRSLGVKWKTKPTTNVSVDSYTRITPSFKSKDGVGVVFSDKSCVDVSFDSGTSLSASFVEVCPVDIKLPCFTTKGWDNDLPWINEKGWNN